MDATRGKTGAFLLNFSHILASMYEMSENLIFVIIHYHYFGIGK